MKIVIDIDEDIYNRFTYNEAKPHCEITEKERFQMGADAIRLTRAFCNGIPLPNGHGNLKDVDSIFNEGFPNADINAEYEENRKKYPLWRTDITGFQSILKNAPTIIEANKEIEK